MIKQHRILLGGKSKSGLLSKLFILSGVILFILYIIFLFVFHYTKEASIILAFAILFIGVGGIFYFFHYEFTKLERIAAEVEQETEDNQNSDSGQEQ